MKARSRILLIAAALLAAAAADVKPVYNFEGGVKTHSPVPAQDLYPQAADNWFYTWCYTYILIMDDGSSATVQFTYWKVSYVSRYGVIFYYIDQDGKRHYQEAIYEEDQVAVGKDPFTLAVGPNNFRANHPDYKIHIDLPRQKDGSAMRADLQVKSLTPSWRPGKGPVHYGAPDGDWYDLVVPLPWGDLSGSIAIDGNKVNIAGRAYMDHNFQTVLPTEQMGWLMALRSFSDDLTVNFLEYVAPEQYGQTRSTWILVMKKGEILYATDKWTYEFTSHATEKKTGYDYPTAVKVKIDEPGIKLNGTIRSLKVIEVVEPLDRLPQWIREVAEKFFQAPAIIRQNVEVEWELEMPEKGIDVRKKAMGVFEKSIIN